MLVPSASSDLTRAPTRTPDDLPMLPSIDDPVDWCLLPSTDEPADRCRLPSADELLDDWCRVFTGGDGGSRPGSMTGSTPGSGSDSVSVSLSTSYECERSIGPRELFFTGLSNSMPFSSSDDLRERGRPMVSCGPGNTSKAHQSSTI